MSAYIPLLGWRSWFCSFKVMFWVDEQSWFLTVVFLSDEKSWWLIIILLDECGDEHSWFLIVMFGDEKSRWLTLVLRGVEHSWLTFLDEGEPWLIFLASEWSWHTDFGVFLAAGVALSWFDCFFDYLGGIGNIVVSSVNSSSLVTVSSSSIKNLVFLRFLLS